MNSIIEIKGLKKKYKNGFQFGEVNLSLDEGKIIGVVGEDGAGKTTLLKCILNIRHKDFGTVKIFGKDIEEYDNDIKEDIGVVMDDVFIPEIFNPKEIDGIMINLYKNWDSGEYFSYLNKFEIPLDKKILTLSTGALKKFQLAVALSHHPKILVLDEPTNGLDPIVKSEVLKIFTDFIKEKNHTIILSSNIPSELERIADDIIFIDRGEVVLEGSKETILNTYGIASVDEKTFKSIKAGDYASYVNEKDLYHLLISNKANFKKSYKRIKVEDIKLEELIILMAKGVK